MTKSIGSWVDIYTGRCHEDGYGRIADNFWLMMFPAFQDDWTIRKSRHGHKKTDTDVIAVFQDYNLMTSLGVN